MGFGRGIDEAPRQGVEVMDPRFAGPWRHATVAMAPGLTPLVVFDTPERTPALFDLALLTDARARDEHAFRLVQQFEPGRADGLRAERTVLGDARDLFAHVVRRRYSGALRVASTDGGPAAEAPDAGVVVVHLGETAFARAVLREVCAGRSAWNGDPARLDGDGYAILTVRAEGATGLGGHVLVVGGSEYGTYFGVVALLEETFRAAWVFPGGDGEVIPRPLDVGGLTVSGVDLDYNVFEEPTVRSRSFAVMTTQQLHASEIDASRAWQLRNRMRPGQERNQIYQQWLNRSSAPAAPCGEPPTALVSKAFHFAMMEPEERVASNHVIGRMLSPFLPPMSAEVGVAGHPDAAPRFRSRMSVYPDVRAREELDGASRAFDAPRVGMVHPLLGALPPIAFPPTVVDACTDVPATCCPVFVPFAPAALAGVGPGPSRHLEAPFERFCGTMQEVVSGLRLQRFIPRAFLHHRDGPMLPFAEWHPCVFEINTALPFGRPLAVRAPLADDLANQVVIALQGRELRGRDRTHSLAFEDGRTWCHCDACTRSDNSPPTDGNLLLYRGQLIATTRNEDLACNKVTFEGRPGTAHVADRGGPRDAPLMTATQWNAAPARNPFADMTLDALALRGVIFHPGYPSENTHRVLSLADAVCRRVATAQVRPGVLVRDDGAFVSTDGVGAVPAARAPSVDEPLLTVFAYLTAVAPPLLSPSLPDDPGERCHRYLLPLMAGVRDTAEYAAEPFAGADGSLPAWTEEGALDRLRRAPDQFNQERWAAAGALRIGLYEYLLTSAFAAPRVYSRRLRTALMRGERFRVRAFVAEATPAWGLSGPSLWEWSRLLWRPTRDAAAVRRAYCDHAFGPASATMARYLEECEAACASTRDEQEVFTLGATPRQRRPDVCTDSTTGAGYLGQGYGGRGAFLSQLDGWYRETTLGAAGQSRLEHAWSLLNQARREAARDPGALARVGLVRRTFGFTLLIALWYQPLHEAFERIRRERPGHGSLQELVRLFGKDFVRPTSTLPATHPDVGLGHYVRNTTGGAAATVAGVVPRDDFARTRSNTTTALPPVAMDAEVRLRDALRARFEAGGASSVRALRNDVHRYLALSGLSGFPSLAGTTLPGELDGLGFGLFSPSSGTAPPMMPNAAFPDPGTMVGPHRMVGLYLPSVVDYVNWWNNVKFVRPPGGMPRERTPLEQSVLVREDEAGIGWIFDGIKQMAAVILLYTSGLETERVSLQAMKLAVMEG